MVNIGFLGAVSAGKTSLLRNFVKYLNVYSNANENGIATVENFLGKENDKSGILNNKQRINSLNLENSSEIYRSLNFKQDQEIIRNINKCKLLRTDFSGESTMVTEGDKPTKTIHPNRVIFSDVKGNNHTLFAPGGDRERAVVRMGIITISRIAKEIVAVFSLDEPLKKQFEFYNSIRYFPKKIYVALNKTDLLLNRLMENGNDSLSNEFEKRIIKIKSDIVKYFEKRKVKVGSFFNVCAEDLPKFERFNIEAFKMIMNIAEPNSAAITDVSDQEGSSSKTLHSSEKAHSAAVVNI